MRDFNFFKLSVAFFFVMNISFLFAEEPHGNLVIATGETWGTYIPANYDYDWPFRPVKTDVTEINAWLPQACIFSTTLLVTSAYFGNPPWSWMAGKIGMDFSNGLIAVEFNPSEEFAAVNALVTDESNKHYAFLKYVPTVAGADDPARNYHDPAGGAYLSPDRTHAWATAAWPTTVGVDVKLTVHSWTMPWGHLDDFHLVEIELYNTGETDLNGDGQVELQNNKIQALNLFYWPKCFYFKINKTGGRTYYVLPSRYRGSIIDLTPDENGAPWDIHCQAIGSTVTEAEDHPGVANDGEYFDAYHGYGWLGAKKWHSETQQWVEKFLCFKDQQGNQIVPAIGEGQQRGWFRTSQPGWGRLFDGTEKRAHTASMGCFYVDGGKSNDGFRFDLNPNPALFAAGNLGDPTTFIVKTPNEWTYPDGAWEKAEPVMYYDPVTGKALGISPVDPDASRGRALEPDIITEGLISQYGFDGDPICAIGPFDLEGGERIRLYFYRGSGFRILGLRKTVKMARAVFEAIQNDGSYQLPPSPPVPEIKVGITAEVKPIVKWQSPTTLGDLDGIKIYKSVSFPEYSSLNQLYPTHDTWWKTMDPAIDPGQAEINPLMTRLELLRDQAGDYWGPYQLVKVIPVSAFSDFQNPQEDVGVYPFAWEDDTETIPGQRLWYYVASYKAGAANLVAPPFQNLDDVDWLESGKVNINGRTGQWENTWPWATQHSYFPTDEVGLKNLGAALVLTSSNPEDALIHVTHSQIDFKKCRVGDYTEFSDGLTITNRGKANLVIDSVAVPPEFSINLLPRDFPVTLTPPGGITRELKLTVGYQPLAAGIHTGNLIIYHSDADTTALSISLAGTSDQTPNQLTDSNRWYQFGLAGRSCQIQGNPFRSDTLFATDSKNTTYFYSYDAGATWQPMSFIRPAEASRYYNDYFFSPNSFFAEKLFFDPKDDQRIYYEFIGGLFNESMNKTWRSDDNGKNWVKIFQGNSPVNSILTFQFVQIIIDPNHPERVYRAFGDSLAASPDAGNHWRQLNPGISGSMLVIATSNSDVLYYYAQYGIVKSNNAGQSWQRCPLLPGPCYHLAIDPTDANILFGIFRVDGEVKILKSVDGGETWQEKSHGIDPEIEVADPFISPVIVLNPQYRNEIVFGTRSTLQNAGAVYWSNDGGEAWHKLSTDWLHYSPHIEQLSVNNLLLTLQNDVTLVYAATNDGIFKIQKPGETTAAEAARLTTPKRFNLSPNYPNPFNPTTTIRYQIPYPTWVNISIYNSLGQKIRTLTNTKKAAGIFSIEWNGQNDAQQEVANGIYIVRMVAGTYSQTIKMLLLK